MKEIYNTPELEIIDFLHDDIILTSTVEEETSHEDEGVWSENW